MKNIKKFYPLIVGLVLLVSVAAYGTRAFFTDSTKEDAGIELQLGNIDIESKAGNWIYNSTGQQDNQLKDENDKVLIGKEFSASESFTNVKPGDSFSKTFTFKNTSSLKSVFSFEETVSAAVKKPFDVNYTVEDKYKTAHVLNGEESVDVTMIINIPTDTDVNKFNSGNEKDFLANSNIMDLMSKSITVKLEQAK